jgi:hypothetical protein
MVDAGAQAIASKVHGSKDAPVLHADRTWARAVLDAVLPEITTEEQIEALPDGSVLMSLKGGDAPQFHQWYSRDGWLISIAEDDDYRYLNEFLKSRDQISVVWRP